MKLLKYIMIFAFSGVSIFAQSLIDPPPLIFDFKDANGTDRHDILKTEYFPNQFIIGWQWGQHPRITISAELSIQAGLSVLF